MIQYKMNAHVAPVVKKQDGSLFALDKSIFLSALTLYQEKINILYGANIDIAGLLGLRNLSAAIGELFVQSIAEISSGLFVKNPHQDGYPDLLLMDNDGIYLYNQIKQENLLQEKARFSSFASGGMEVKATCGSIPSQAECNRKGVQRPDLGVQRIDLLKGYDWKAHHRETNNLIGITWDFIEGIPTITSVQYSSALSELSWGHIVQPAQGGGRTTSVSIMTREGVATMCKGWIIMIDDKRYIDFFCKYNSLTLF